MPLGGGISRARGAGQSQWRPRPRLQSHEHILIFRARVRSVTDNALQHLTFHICVSTKSSVSKAASSMEHNVKDDFFQQYGSVKNPNVLTKFRDLLKIFSLILMGLKESLERQD